MKTNIMRFGAMGFFLLVAVALIAVTTVAAQTATSTATSSEEVVDAVPPETTPETATASATEVTTSDAPSAESEATASLEVAAEVTPIEAAPEGLTKVIVIGTKYIDYFTDGEKEYSFPGDRAIDAHLGEKDAPIPTHEGLTWVHTIGQHLYDTASGDLEEGQYALQSNGTYIAKSLPFVTSPSTPAVLGASSTSTEPIPSDTSPDDSSTTTSPDATTSTDVATSTP